MVREGKGGEGVPEPSVGAKTRALLHVVPRVWR